MSSAPLAEIKEISIQCMEQEVLLVLREMLQVSRASNRQSAVATSSPYPLGHGPPRRIKRTISCYWEKEASNGQSAVTTSSPYALGYGPPRQKIHSKKAKINIAVARKNP
jgi:hypothetical protein